MGLCDDDKQTAKAWLAAGHPPIKIAVWLFCDVRHVRELIGQRPRKVAVPPTPPELRRRCAELRAGDDAEERKRRDVYTPRYPMKVPIVCLRDAG